MLHSFGVSVVSSVKKKKTRRSNKNSNSGLDQAPSNVRWMVAAPESREHHGLTCDAESVIFRPLTSVRWPALKDIKGTKLPALR